MSRPTFSSVRDDCPSSKATPKTIFQTAISTGVILMPLLAITQEGSVMPAITNPLVIGMASLLLVMLVTVADRFLLRSVEMTGLEGNAANAIDGGLVLCSNGPGGVVKLSKGFNINIKGKAQSQIKGTLESATFAVKPVDFHGMAPIPKMMVEVGQEVKAGDGLFFDKNRPDVLFTSPVSGEVAAITRGAKRAIVEVVVLADNNMNCKAFSAGNPQNLSRDQIKETMLESGAWTLMRQRPYNMLADQEVVPKAIHVSGFNSGPLATDLNLALEGKDAAFQAGLHALGKLTDGKVHLNLNAATNACSALANAKDVVVTKFQGKHPAGTVGVQIHHIDPINKGDHVCTMAAQDVATLGTLFLEGKYSPERVVNVAGPEVKNPHYVKTWLGANIENLVKDNLATDNVRYISGSVLTGRKIEPNGHLCFFDDQVSVIQEGDFHEFIGWLVPSYGRPSLSRTFLSALSGSKEFRVNTNTHGEDRAFVMTGQYEQVLPMDIYPVHLLKSILFGDLDQMEGLGLYEVVEEDMALCEFVCTSKQPVQKILREGMEIMIEQT